VRSLLSFPHRKDKASQAAENPSGMSENTSNKSASPQNDVKGQQMFFPITSLLEDSRTPSEKSFICIDSRRYSDPEPCKQRN